MKKSISFIVFFLLITLTRLTAQGSEFIAVEPETFNFQPGAIKSLTTLGKGEWILEVDLLTPNPNWKAGIDSTIPFFLNPDPTIRTLNINSKTLTYRCGDTTVYMPGKTAEFMKYIQTRLENIKTNSEKFGNKPYDYTAYFTITNSHIDAISEQCLP